MGTSCIWWKLSATLYVLSFVMADDLFTATDNILILNNVNMNRTLEGSDTFVMVNFYSSWCGHCHDFAPTYKKLALDIKGWAPVIQLGAINCADKVNHDTCRHFKIEGYPSLKVFLPHKLPKDTGKEYRGDRSRTKLRHGMIRTLGNPNSTAKYKTLTKLLPLGKLEDIWHDVGPDVEHTVVIFEEEKSYVGAEVILDMWRYKQVVIRRLLKEDVVQYGVKKFPSMYLIEKGAAFQNLASNGTGRDDFVRALRRLLKLPENAITKQPITVEKAKEPVLGSHDLQARKMQPGVYIQDLTSAIKYSLRQEVTNIHSLEGATLQAVKDYLSVLTKYFPGDRATMVYLSRLNNWIRLVKQPITGDQWSKTLIKFEDSKGYLPSNSSYIGCRGSEERFRGYPCGLWMLFHTLTVSSVQISGEDEKFDDLEVLRAMEGYVTKIFGCDACGKNFVKEIKDLEEDVEEPEDAILFLWEVHNSVNARLHGATSEDPFYPKAQFPSRSLCPSCYADEQSDTPTFNNDNVLPFLESFYSRQKIIGQDRLPGMPLVVLDSKDLDMVGDVKGQGQTESILHENRNWWKNNSQHKEDFSWLGARKASKQVDLQTANKQEATYDKQKIDKLKKQEKDSRLSVRLNETASSFTSVDLSMCVFFYVACTGILIMAYFHFTVRRRMKPTCCCGNIV